MADWKTMDTAPQDGRNVLLWATLRTIPPYEEPGPVVGRWHKAPVEQWKPVPDLLDKGTALIPYYWTDIPDFPYRRHDGRYGHWA